MYVFQTESLDMKSQATSAFRAVSSLYRPSDVSCIQIVSPLKGVIDN